MESANRQMHDILFQTAREIISQETGACMPIERLAKAMAMTVDDLIIYIVRPHRDQVIMVPGGNTHILKLKDRSCRSCRSCR